MSNRWTQLAERVLEGKPFTRQEGFELLRTPDSDVLDVLKGAEVLRRHYHGNRVKIHVLCNAKSGLCPEDCGFCTQSSVSQAPIARYRMMSPDEIYSAAERAKKAKAWKFCMVIASKGPSDEELDVIVEAVRKVKKSIAINVCTSLGILKDGQAEKLKEAGVDRFNHNLETSQRHFPNVCSTHTYEDRVSTIKKCQKAGLGTCCGGIVGMGETDEDVIDWAFALRDLNVDSIPVNFLNSIEGTPLAGKRELKPTQCLRTLALARFTNPSKDIRVAGGREVNLRSAQSLALFAVNSIFTDGYLTTLGRDHHQDHRMIEDAGFEIQER
jgi:biotin synthase